MLHQADPERQEKVWSAETFRSYTDLCLSLFGPDRFQMMSKEIELKGHMMLMNVKKKISYNVNSDACSAPTGRFVKWQGQNTARSPKKV